MPQKKKSGKKPQVKKGPQPPKDLAYYFVVSGEIEYREKDGAAQYAKTNMIHEERIIPGKPDGVTVAGLAKIQEGLQMHFHAHYSKSHPAPPEITNVTILSVSHLGIFSRAQFYGEPKKATNRPAEPSLPSAPAEQTLPTAKEPETAAELGTQVLNSHPVDAGEGAAPSTLYEMIEREKTDGTPVAPEVTDVVPTPAASPEATEPTPQ